MEINDNMAKTLGEDSPCYSTMNKWVSDFKRGREDTDDEAQKGRIKSATADAQVEGLNRMMMNDRHEAVKHIADTLGLSVVSVHTDLTVIFGMSKQSARWVPQTKSLKA